MILRAAVFSSRVLVTILFGFFTKLPRVELAHDSPYEVFQRVDTGDFYLIMLSSNCGAPIVLVRSSLKHTDRFLLIILTLQKPKAKSILLSSLIKS